MEKSYKEIAKGTFGGATIKPDALTMRYRVPKNGKPRLNIKLGVDVLKKAKLNIKDRIDLVIDDEINKAFIRPDADGWKIDGAGKTGAGVFNLPWNSDRLFEFDSEKAVDIKWSWTKAKGVEFSIPEQEPKEETAEVEA